ncbi:MAG: type II toxin-antitoxin system HicA family toxin [Bacteroidales bacterium]|nr:type II toxin-antitoxin system HicA family toxin [Bacteroidales bacterium]
MKKLSNITLDEFRTFLKAKGLTMQRTNGGHEMWSCEGMPRPVVFQTHIDPLPEFVVKNNLMAIGVSRKEFLDFFEA